MMEAINDDDEPRKNTVSHRRRFSFTILLLLIISLSSTTRVSGSINESGRRRRVIEARTGQDLIWVVQLSDLHFSVHRPERAIDFKNIVGPALSLINPSLVLITGDLTDGKSKDRLAMKQDEDEWLEYSSVMQDVVKRSGLNKTLFYDLRGNHDKFGVPSIGSSVDFFSKYSINGQMNRKENINTVTIETSERKHLFVGIDTTMDIGLRGPTNLFGHPTDELLSSLDSHLSQWDSQSAKPVTKVSFGHFPLSFSALSESRKSLKDVFLKHSISAYLCGHLHTKFGKNLKRHHRSGGVSLSDNDLFQLNMRRSSVETATNCSFGALPDSEFWEWEMGDWKDSRAMRIIAIDRGHVSYLDLDFKSKTEKTIVLPTFPLDSRFMSTSFARQRYECQHMISSSYDAIRAIVFSRALIVEVVARVYDSSSGFDNDNLVMEGPMRKHGDDSSPSSGASFYSLPWNYRAFEDPLPDRYWLQIEVIDVKGRSTLSEMRPFSINGLTSKLSWTWNEFRVMGIQWSALYYPILWSVLYCLFLVFLIPKVLIVVFKKQYTFKKFKGPITLVLWILQDVCRIPIVWFGYIAYLIYLIFFPWFSGEIFTNSGNRTYMTIMGWVVTSLDNKKHEYIGLPEVMVLVIPHLIFVVIPSVFLVCGLVAEREIYKDYVRTVSGKKEDDHDRGRKKRSSQRRSLLFDNRRLIRKSLLLASLALYWKHFKNCWGLGKAYEMNMVLHFPGYSFVVPLLLLYVICKTHKV